MQRQQQRFGVRFSAADIDIRRAVIYLEVSHIFVNSIHLLLIVSIFGDRFSTLGPQARPDRRFARGFSCVVRVVAGAVAGAVAVVVVVVVAIVFVVAVAVVGLFVVLVLVLVLVLPVGLPPLRKVAAPGDQVYAEGTG
jgi:hypothetical protein